MPTEQETISQPLEAILQDLKMSIEDIEFKEDGVHIVLDAEVVPEPGPTAQFLWETISDTIPEGTPRVCFYCREKGKALPSWTEEVKLIEPLEETRLRAQQGDREALKSLFDISFEQWGVSIVELEVKKGCLTVLLESGEEMHPPPTVGFVRNSMAQLQTKYCDSVHVYFRVEGSSLPLWDETAPLIEKKEKPKAKSAPVAPTPYLEHQPWQPSNKATAILGAFSGLIRVVGILALIGGVGILLLAFFLQQDVRYQIKLGDKLFLYFVAGFILSAFGGFSLFVTRGK